MKTMKKLLPLLLCVMMVVAAFAVTTYAADGAPNIGMEFSATEVNVGDTFTVTVYYDAMEIASIGCPLIFDQELVEFVSALPCDPDYPDEFGLCTKRGFVPGTISTYDEANSIGQVGFVIAGTENTTFKGCEIYTATFRAKAAGTVTFTLMEDTSGPDGYKGVAATQTVTIAGSEPVCEHEYFYACDAFCMHCGELTNPDAKHSMVHVAAKPATCTENGNIEYWYCDYCGGCWDNENAAGMPLNRYMVTINAKHEYTYACDAHCAICHELTNEGAEHNIIYVEAVDATCDENGNIEYWYCEICGSAWADEELTQVTNLKSVILPAGHSFLEGRRGAPLSVGDCVTPATYATKCDRCDVEDKTKVITGEKNPDNHTEKAGYTNNGENHTVTYPCCETETTEAHSYNADHECVCGDVEKFYVYNSYGESTHEFAFAEGIVLPEPGKVGYNFAGWKFYTYTFDDDNWEFTLLEEYNGTAMPAFDLYAEPQWTCDHTAENHTYTYTYNDENHTVKCECGHEIVTEEHDYTHEVEYSEGALPNTHHKEAFCVCGACEMSDAEHTDANADGSCDECELHTCVIELVDGKPATCTEDGWYSYGYCEGCGTYYTYEAEREQFYPMERDFEEWKAGEGKIPATGHSGYYSFEFYVDGSFCTVEMSFYCTTCEKIVGDPMAFNDEGMLFTGAFCNRTGVLTKTFSFKNALPENCSWDNFELKGELPETPNFNNIWEEETATLIYGWATPLDPNNHWSREVTYHDITDEQHTVYHPCCEATETVDHTFDETTHKCVCGEVEKFILSLSLMDKNGDWQTVEIDVPFGEKLMDYLKDYIPDYTVRVNDEYFNGEWIFDNRYYDYDTGDWLSGDKTMPAHNLALDQNWEIKGWWFNYDSENQYVGAEYYTYDEEVGWYWLDEGWHYIEENYDDVEGGAWYYFCEGTGEWAEFWNFRVEGLTRVPYPTVVIEGTTYGPDQEAIDYAAGKGQTFIDAESALFLFGADGKFQFEVSGLYEGHVYSAGMQKWHPGLIEIGGEYYYFIGDVENGGNIAANGETYITRNNGNDLFAIGALFIFENGKLSTKHGVVDGYYYENGQLMIGKGLVQLPDGRWIYVRSNGAVATGVYYVGEQKWEFDENGYAEDVKNGIIGGKYYVNGHVQYGAGLVAYDNGYIYVRSNGEVVTGTYWITNTNGKLPAGKYEFGADGKMLPVKDGIVEVEGVLYYYDNNHVQYGAGLVEIEEGVYVYVRSNGQLAIGEYWVTNSNEDVTGMKAGKYTFGEDGKLIIE